MLTFTVCRVLVSGSPPCCALVPDARASVCSRLVFALAVWSWLVFTLVVCRVLVTGARACCVLELGVRASSVIVLSYN